MAITYHNRIAGFDAIHELMWIGAADPSATPGNDVQPFQWWLDTTGGTTLHAGAVLKSRNSGNTGWDLRFDLASIRGVASGLATLDAGGLIPTAQLPPLAITDVFVVASQAAMLALTAERGDVAIRTDVTKTFILSTNSPSTLADWKEVLVGAAAPSGTAGGVLGGSYPNPSLGSFSSANLASALTDETGSGAAVFATGPTLSGPLGIVENDIGASTHDAGNTGTAITIDWSLGRTQKVTATGNFTLTHSNMVAGLVYTLEVLTGAGSFTATFSSTSWAGGTAPTVTATASKTDVFTFYKTIGGTILGGIFGQAF